MRALHATGRSADALRVGYDHRRCLRTGAGLDPTPVLARLERDIASAATQRSGARRAPGPLRGRDSELAALHRLLARERLVTVLGPGGVGKSRLAAEIAARIGPVTELRLAPVTAAALIPDTLAGALDLRVVQGGVLAACAALLAAGPQLLVIDNCEHLLSAVRDVVATLLDRCPQLTVLATSREPLGLAGEQRLRLAPLTLAGTHDVARSPAVAVSSTGRGGSVRTSCPARASSVSLPRSHAGSTGCRSRSSSPPGASRHSGSPISTLDSTARSTCSPTVA